MYNTLLLNGMMSGCCLETHHEHSYAALLLGEARAGVTPERTGSLRPRRRRFERLDVHRPLSSQRARLNLGEPVGEHCVKVLRVQLLQLHPRLCTPRIIATGRATSTRRRAG